tara:strand:- start:25 stop:657 length:633 start_codon:yes stop_codon:yes gene_type:complete
MLQKNLTYAVKKSYFAAEQEREDVQKQRDDYIDSIENINPDDIIVIDESGADLKMTNDYARAEGGERAKAPKPHIRGERYSIIGAITLTTILAVTYTNSAINYESFKTFIENFLIPALSPGKYVILDNVSFHKQATIIELIESTGAKVVFLPPYSPDLSPIEKMWSKVKEMLRRDKPRTREDFHKSLSIALDIVSEEDLENWYEDCGYAV